MIWSLSVFAVLSFAIILCLSSYRKLYVNVFVAWGTLMLAAATFLLVLSTYWQEKHRKREDLLNHIIEWATDAIMWDIDKTYEANKQLQETEEPLWFIFAQLIRLSTGFGDMIRKGRLTIRPLTLALNQEALKISVNKVLEELQNQIELIGFQEIAIMKDIYKKSQTHSDEFIIADTRVAEHTKILRISAEKVIEEATKIKARDI